MEGKVVLVTGANKGIGFEIVRQLAALKHRVILTARNSARGEEARKSLHGQGLEAIFHGLDVTNAGDIEQTRVFVERTYGKLDVLINNAGISMKEDRSLPDVADAVWSSLFATNAEAPLRVARGLYPLLPRGGRIINISSGGGSMSDPVGGWSPVYCITKSTLNAITRHLDHYLAPRGISVNAVCPGWVKTDLGGSSAPGSVTQGADTAVWLATQERIPSGKLWRDRKPIAW